MLQENQLNLKLNFRNPKIDFLRGIAILLVLFLHFQLAYNLAKSPLNSIFAENFIIKFTQNGNYGVTIFFVISGFLIASIAIQRYGDLSKIDVFGFYILRFARIMPCLFLALTIITLLHLTPLTIFHNKPDSTSFGMAIISALTFWHNILMQKVGYFNYTLNIYWSLSVEEIFYLIFPLSCALFKKNNRLIFFWVLLIILAPIYRHLHDNNEIVALYGYISCFDGIAIGCCAAICADHISRKKYAFFSAKCWKILQIVAISIGVSTYFYSNIMANITFGVSLMAISTAILLMEAVQPSANNYFYNIDNRNFIVRGIDWFGRHSYELYLFHIIVLALMKEIYAPQTLSLILNGYGKLLWMMLFFLLSVFTAGGIAKFYSIPINKKLRRQIFNSR